MNKLLATLIAGAFVATSTMAIAQTAAPAPVTPPAASSSAMKSDSMKHEGKTTVSKKHARKAKRKAAIAREDQMIKDNTKSSNSAVKAEPATGGAAMSKSEAKGK